MAERDYFEPAHLLYDWQNGQSAVDAQQSEVIRQTEADIDAYIGYPEIQLDIARTAVAHLAENTVTSETVAEVVDIASAKPKLETVFVVVKSDPETKKVLAQ